MEVRVQLAEIVIKLPGIIFWWTVSSLNKKLLTFLALMYDVTGAQIAAGCSDGLLSMLLGGKGKWASGDVHDNI